MNRTLLALVAVLSLAASAGTKVTEKPMGWRATPESPALKTHDDCVKAAAALGAGVHICTYATELTVELTCDDVPKPVMPTIIDAEGRIVRPGIVVKPLTDQPDSEWGPTMEEGFVKGPGFPNCWVLGLVPYEGEFHAPDGPPDLSPSPFVYGVDPEWPIGGKCPSTDPKLCYVPPHPDVPPASP